MCDSWSADSSAGVAGEWDRWAAGSGEESISIESSAPTSNAGWPGDEDASPVVLFRQSAGGDACGEIFAERKSARAGVKPRRVVGCVGGLSYL